MYGGVVRTAIAPAVEPVAVGPPAAGRDRSNPAQMRERGFGTQPVGVVTGSDEYLSGDVSADPGQRHQSWSRRGHHGAKLGIGGTDLLGQVLVAPGQAAQRGLGGMFGIPDVAGWSQPGAGRDQLDVAQCPQLLAQLRWGGDKQRP